MAQDDRSGWDDHTLGSAGQGGEDRLCSTPGYGYDPGYGSGYGLFPRVR